MSEKYKDVELPVDNNINQTKGKFMYQNIQYFRNSVSKGNVCLSYQEIVFKALFEDFIKKIIILK